MNVTREQLKLAIAVLVGFILGVEALSAYEEYQLKHQPPHPHLSCSNGDCAGICCRNPLNGQHVAELCKCTRRCAPCR